MFLPLLFDKEPKDGFGDETDLFLYGLFFVTIGSAVRKGDGVQDFLHPFADLSGVLPRAQLYSVCMSTLLTGIYDHALHAVGQLVLIRDDEAVGVLGSASCGLHDQAVAQEKSLNVHIVKGGSTDEGRSVNY